MVWLPLTLAMMLPSPARAQTVLVPEFTPAVADDFTLAYMFYSFVTEELDSRGTSYADGIALREMAGADAENCGESISCPSALWGFYPEARIALVGVVGLVNAGQPDEGIEIVVDFYERDGFAPLKSVERTIVPGQEPQFAAAIARATSVLVDRLVQPAQEEPDSARATGAAQADVDSGEGLSLPWWLTPWKGRDTGKNEEPPELHGDETLYQSYYDVQQEGESRRRERGVDATPEPGQPGRYLGRERRRPKADGEARVERQPRSRPDSTDGDGLVSAEVWAGMASGDLSRSYDVRIATMGSTGAQAGRYEHDSLVGGLGADFGLGVYGRALPWVEAGLRLGLVTGRKYLSTGWESWTDGGQQSADVQAYQPSAALRGLVEPRVRVAPLDLAGFKPVASGFLAFRRYDRFVVSDLVDIDFPERGGGWLVSPGLGLGLQYDLGGGRALVGEISHGFTLGDHVEHAEIGLVEDVPELPASASGYTGFTLGFTQSFL